MQKSSIIICDIDGVLADERVRRNKFLKKAQDTLWKNLDTVEQAIKTAATMDYDGYYSDVSNDGHISHLWKLLEGKKVIFLTGRRESCRHQTLLWLERLPYIKANTKFLRMRSEWDYRHASILKSQMALQVMEEFDVSFAIDDNEDICLEYRKLGISTICCKFYDL